MELEGSKATFRVDFASFCNIILSGEYHKKGNFR
jgi:hypothetical protein